MEQKIYSVAIDGPGGAGKSTIARAVAHKLGVLYVDTGAIYRSVGYHVYLRGIEPFNIDAVIALLPETHIEMAYGEDGLQRMYLNGEDVTSQIRLPEMSMYASKVSAIPAVRDFLMEMQRSMARKNSVVMDGRDIGTVVLPDAEVKIFLTADLEERAKRRYRELQERGISADFDTILEEMRQRDYNDSHRKTAPLKAAENAVVVDTTYMDYEQSCQRILDIIRERVGV